MCGVQVHLVLEDAAGNVMPVPEVPVATTLPDRHAPLLRATSPCGTSLPADTCTPDPGRKFCGNAGPTHLDMFFQINEGGAAYFLLTKLPTSGSIAQRLECEELQIGPGEMYEVPEGEQWRGCAPPADARRRLRASSHFNSASASGLRGDGGDSAAGSRRGGVSTGTSHLGLKSKTGSDVGSMHAAPDAGTLLSGSAGKEAVAVSTGASTRLSHARTLGEAEDPQACPCAIPWRRF